MKISKEVIEKFNPCKERFDVFLENYPNFNGSFDDFLDLNKITYEDKIWVAKKILNKNQLVHFGLLCAESVLNIFETKYPKDKRVGDCIRYLKSIANFSDLSLKQKEKIRKHRSDAAYAADAAAAAYDAAAAAYDAAAAAYAAAAYAAYDAAAAAYAAAAYAAYDAAAADAAAAAAADAAAAAAYDAAAARKNQQNINLEFLKMAASL